MPVFYILADSVSAECLWACLLEALEEFGASIVALEGLRQYGRQTINVIAHPFENGSRMTGLIAL